MLSGDNDVLRWCSGSELTPEGCSSCCASSRPLPHCYGNCASGEAVVLPILPKTEAWRLGRKSWEAVTAAFFLYSPFTLMAVTPSSDWRSKGSWDISTGGHLWNMGLTWSTCKWLPFLYLWLSSWWLSWIIHPSTTGKLRSSQSPQGFRESRKIWCPRILLDAVIHCKVGSALKYDRQLFQNSWRWRGRWRSTGWASFFNKREGVGMCMTLNHIYTLLFWKIYWGEAPDTGLQPLDACGCSEPMKPSYMTWCH